MSVLERPSRDRTLMDIAIVVSRRSTCSRASVGAIVAIDGRVLSMGYNGAPAGIPHCTEADHPPHFPSCVKSVHAEMNALIFAARHGTAVRDAEMFTTVSPCEACCVAVVNAGISRVVYHQEYRITRGLEVLSQAGVYHELLTP